MAQEDGLSASASTMANSAEYTSSYLLLSSVWNAGNPAPEYLLYKGIHLWMPFASQEQRSLYDLLKKRSNLDGLLGGHRYDTNDAGHFQSASELALHDLFEFDDAVNQGEETVVPGYADVVTGLVLHAVLANDAVASNGVLVAEDFHAKTL